MAKLGVGNRDLPGSACGACAASWRIQLQWPPLVPSIGPSSAPRNGQEAQEVSTEKLCSSEGLGNPFLNV